jgi:antitoxin component YwqK of YwqJK toxin-antitoxin module
LLLVGAESFSQSQAASPDSLFLDASWKITKHRSLAKYFREYYITGEDSIITVHDYYLSTGNKQMIGTYVKEMKAANQNGRFQYFYENGSIKAIYDYQYGIIHGELRKFYKNGQLKSVEKYDLGTKVDTTWSYYSNGQLRMIQVQNKDFSAENPSDKFKRTRLISAYGKTGETQVSNGLGIYKEYYLSGKTKSSIEYMNGFPHGKWIRYSGEKKKVSCEMTFKNGTFIKGEMYDNGKKDIFSSLQRKPYFPSGIRGLDKFIDDNTGSCKSGFDNEVLALVSVSTRGKVSLEQIISGNVDACQLEEIQMLISNMPLWAPAVQDGIYTEGSQTIRITYSE